MKLIATRPLRYNTRSLVAGDEFEATDMHARILVGIRKARHAPDKTAAPAVSQERTVRAEPPAHVAANYSDLDKLRVEAQQLGVEVDGRWGDIRLRHEIAQAKQSR